MLESEYEYVDIVFENCNIVRISPENILFMEINNIFDEIIINSSGQFIWYKRCDYFQIVLKNDALKIKTSFEKVHDSIHSSFSRHLDVYKDITSVYIKKKNEEKEIHVVLPYDTADERHDNPNVLMEVFYNDNSFVNVEHFKIVIKGKKQ